MVNLRSLQVSCIVVCGRGLEVKLLRLEHHRHCRDQRALCIPQPNRKHISRAY